MDRLRTIGLTKTYGGVPVVDGIDLEFVSGRVTALLGRNGAGKTTTFLMIAGIVRPDCGRVELNNESVNDIPSTARARKGLIYLPQQHSVFMKASALDNLFMVLEMLHPAAEARDRALELLGEFGLLAVKDSMAYQLSGGEKRRLEIARALIMKPRFLFLDEPFTGIDPITILDIQKVILRLKAMGIGLVITDHNVKDAFYITDLAYIIHKGRILSSGTPAEVVREEKTRQVFLGKDFAWNG
ncbi:MAG: LPS export ABC transporter ATP-binding protein [Acidobacteria bacterium]|jgi:lipopolysaccharide export system ATP-binding protein|nr:LPS export ABC transporter ATP-binding protein [Acidobacteriota bacterium]